MPWVIPQLTSCKGLSYLDMVLLSACVAQKIGEALQHVAMCLCNGYYGILVGMEKTYIYSSQGGSVSEGGGRGFLELSSHRGVEQLQTIIHSHPLGISRLIVCETFCSGVCVIKCVCPTSKPMHSPFSLLIQESDYLHLVYHLYDSDGSDSEAEQEERERRERLASLHARLKWVIKSLVSSPTQLYVSCIWAWGWVEMLNTQYSMVLYSTICNTPVQKSKIYYS